MITILVVEDQAIIREPIAAALRRAGYQTITANHGQEALQQLEQLAPDLVLLDIAMPVMDGLTFLQALRGDHNHKDIPVIMLTAAAEKHRVLEAAKLAVKGYLLKSRFSLTEMIAQVHKVVGPPTALTGDAAMASTGTNDSASSQPGGASQSPPSHMAPRETPSHAPSPPPSSTEPCLAEAEGLRALKPVVTRSEMAALIDNCGELKGFSPAVHEVIKLTSNDRCSIEQVSKAISRDHAVALKILKLANSAVYTRGEHVDSVHKAVLRIGLGQIRQAVLNIAVVEKFSSSAIEGYIESGQFWEHAIATGIIAAEIAHARNEKEADGAFTMGLLHDVGRMVFVSQLGDRYRPVLETARHMQLPLEQVEHRMLCFNHADIMDRVFRQWKFSKEFINPIVFHHLSAGNMRNAAPQEVMQVATLALANRLAHAFMLGSSGNETIYPTEDICDLLRLDPAVIRRIEQTARDETDKVKFALLASSTQTNWAQLRDVHQAEFTHPFRPLYVSAAPAIDAHRIFCDQFQTNGDDAEGGAAPTIGIISFRHVRERLSLSQQYLAAEKNAGPTGLPLLVISPAGKIVPEQALMNSGGGRRVEFIATPMPIARFIAAVNRLTSEQAAAMAA